MFIDVLNWILEDKETKYSQYFCQQKNITEQEFYYFLATHELTLKGKSFLKL